MLEEMIAVLSERGEDDAASSTRQQLRQQLAGL